MNSFRGLETTLIVPIRLFRIEHVVRYYNDIYFTLYDGYYTKNTSVNLSLGI